MGFDAIGGLKHPSFAQALETSMVCEIPFETLDDLSGKMPNLRQQIMRLMSGEIKGDRDMILLLSKKNAEERGVRLQPVAPLRGAWLRRASSG